VNALPPAAAAPPFYLVDVPRLREKFALFRDAFVRHFPRFVVGYSYKTNTLPFIARILHELGAHAEVVSPLEFELARALGVDGARIIVNGPGKRLDFLVRALACGSLVNLDSLDEVRALADWLRARGGAPCTVGLRVNLAIPEALPARRSRFGIPVDDGALAAAATELREVGVEVAALHGHITSRERRLEYWRMQARELARAAEAIGGESLRILDVGGGFGFAPPELGLKLPSFCDYAAVLREELAAGFPRLAEMTLIAEPGIGLVGDCMSYFAPVLSVKRLAGRTIAVVDASVQTVKPSKHKQNLLTHVLDAAFRPKRAPAEACDVVGYTCLEDDVIATDHVLPALEVGDVLRFDNVGAYTSGFKPQFIRARPAFYAFDGGATALVRREESFDEYFAGCEL